MHDLCSVICGFQERTSFLSFLTICEAVYSFLYQNDETVFAVKIRVKAYILFEFPASLITQKKPLTCMKTAFDAHR